MVDAVLEYDFDGVGNEGEEGEYGKQVEEGTHAACRGVSARSKHMDRERPFSSADSG